MGLQSHLHLSRLSSQRAAPVPQRLNTLGILHCGGPLQSSSGKRRSTEGLQLSRTGLPSILHRGFCDWKHPERISDHEKSAEHRQNMLSLLHRSNYTCRVDASLARQCEAEQQYWKEVLRRVVAVIKFMGARGLPFRGDNELLGSAHNGNYLGLLELIAEFDPFLKEHIEKHGNKGRDKPSYLSSTVCEEFISLMGDKTKKVIAEEIRHAKYFSVIIDSSPDLAHVDQLTFVFRVVSADGRVVERLIGFEPIHSHTGVSLAEAVIEMVRGLGLDLSNCRGQSYGNASNMSGKYSGLQAHLKKQNPLIHYTPCAAHSLNLVGVNCIDNCCEEVNSFFDLLQSMYTFCSSSTHHWNTVFHNSKHHIKYTLIPQHH
uniref:zinc finger MYM-type protein 1-like n=1 Tax=Epinephelus lanceolatus TaxID=310571 RepID=UPI0014473E08|nr:zinc finger MYM-type protein 1-like [Epinephelus lanceolatus]